MHKFYEVHGDAGGGEGGGTATAAPENLLVSKSAGDSGTAAPDQKQEGNLTAEPWWDGLANKDGTINKARYEHLPEELKDLRPTLEKLGSFNDLFKTFKHQSSLIGKKGLQPLRPDATDAEKKEFDGILRNVLGVPKTPEEYGIKRPDDMPEELWNDEYASSMAKIMHEEALSPKTVQRLIKANEEATRKAMADMETRQAQAREEFVNNVNKAVQKEWGVNFSAKVDEARRGAKYLGIDPGSPIFTDHPEVAFACQRAYSQFKEAKLISPSDSGPGGMTGQEQLNAMMGDPSHKFYAALRDPSHPQFAEAVRERERVAKLIIQERGGRR